MTDPNVKSTLRSLVFTDLVDSTGLKTRIGDQRAGELIGRYQEHVRRLVKETAGREIDCAGDGFFLTFEAPSAAVGFALRLQETLQSEPELAGVRVGINLGEVTERPAPPGSSKPILVEGLAVDLAARIASLAQAGQVLMSSPVFNTSRQRLQDRGLEREVTWHAHGPYLFQGIDDPIEIGEAGLEGISPLEAPPDAEKARRAVAAGEELTLGWRPAVGLPIPGRLHWVLEEQLGTGAIGEVWLAGHEKTHARRVFKFCFQADRLRNLKREVVLLRVLKESLGSRRDIAQIIDWEFDQAPYFLEMEHTEAGDLVEWARQRGGIEKVPLETRLEIVAEIAEALTAAHGAGVLHKDLKPANVLITEEDAAGRPRVCLTDFGIGLVTSRQALEVPGITVAGLTEALMSSPSSTGAGTRLYMAPEVIEGKEATARSDIYSLGVILYQIVKGDFSHALAPGWERDVEDEFLRADIAACVDGQPELRLPNPSALSERLRTLDGRRALARSKRKRKWLVVGGGAALVVALIGFFGARAVQRNLSTRWARETAIPQIMGLIAEENYSKAFTIARQAERLIPSDPVLGGLWKQMSNEISIRTEPPGARIAYKNYIDPDAQWLFLGESPLEGVSVPLGVLRWKIEKEGYKTLEFAFRVTEPSTNFALEQFDPSARDWQFTLDEEGSLPEGMVTVAGGPYLVSLLGEAAAPVTLDGFLIDKTEVTNEEFKEFVDAGGYKRREFWNEKFIKDGQTLPWEEAMALLRDSTGRPGPATWVQGEYEKGRSRYPVGGVSWYEAAAYCRFRGKSLPTLYHWSRAAIPTWEIVAPLSPAIVALSNLDGGGPAPVASYAGMGVSGAYDLAGNVREWTWNAGPGGRYALGAAWTDPIYAFMNMPTPSAWVRFPTYGFRCAVYPGGEPADSLKAPLERPEQDFYGAPPVPDEVFQALKQVAAYDRGPLNAKVESSVELPWGAREERVTLDTVYGGERLILRLRLPSDVDPPYQAVVWFPGADGMSLRDSRYAIYHDVPNFFVKSGRVLVLPVYAGTYERNDGRTLLRMREPNSRRELARQWLQDLQRTLDYLEEREDIDGSNTAFTGFSLGAIVAPTALAYEPRFRVGILWAGGFAPNLSPEEVVGRVDEVKRTTRPILMLNGRYDFIFPLETHQKPMFELFGTPEEHKRHVVYDTGHWPIPRSELIKESLAWLDRYLGPVEKSGSQVEPPHIPDFRGDPRA